MTLHTPNFSLAGSDGAPVLDALGVLRLLRR
jgi:hypothetical protein